MPEFTTVPVQEAQIRTIPGRQGAFINEYADYIQQVPSGQAGRLRQEMMCIFGGKTEEVNNQEVSAGIPDVKGQRKKQHWIRPSANLRRISRAYQRKNPRN
jgi:hypothetical protein